jgi:hypothetical protein
MQRGRSGRQPVAGGYVIDAVGRRAVRPVLRRIAGRFLGRVAGFYVGLSDGRPAADARR